MNKRLAGYYAGLAAEYITILFYSILGYFLLKHRYKTKFGEIDLIFSKGKCLFFVEVKFRSTNYDDVLCNQHQQRRLVKAGQFFLLQNPKYASFAMQFDFVLIQPLGWPKRVRNFIVS